MISSKERMIAGAIGRVPAELQSVATFIAQIWAGNGQARRHVQRVIGLLTG